MKHPNGKLSGDGSAQARSQWEGIQGFTPKSFCAPPNFAVLKHFFKHMMKTKIIPP